MKSVYSVLHNKFYNLNEELEVRICFTFLISNKDSKKDKIQKDLLNIALSDIPEFGKMKFNHYDLATAFIDLENVVTRCKELDKKLTLKQVLQYLQKAISNERSRFSFNTVITPHKDLVVYHEVDKAKHLGFTFQATYSELKTFINYCLKKLNELEIKLENLKDFKTQFNEKYAYCNPVTNIGKSISHGCSITNYYLNDKSEELLVINEWTFSRDNDSELYYHVKKSELLQEYPMDHLTSRLLRGIGQPNGLQNDIKISTEDCR